MQCWSIPKRHEEGAFVARFGIEYIYVYSKGIILNRFLYRAQWKRSDFNKSFFYGLNATHIFLLCQTFEQ